MEPASTLLTYLATPENLMLQVAVILLIESVRPLLPDLHAHPWFAKLVTPLPVFLCVLATLLLPLSVWATKPWGDRLLLGFVLGGLSGWAHKFVKQTIFGVDDRIQNAPTLQPPKANP